MLSRIAFVAMALACMAVSAVAQDDVLTLTEALQLAKERNGTIRAAAADVLAARSRTRQARSSFFPTVTPSLRYTNSGRDGAGNQSFSDDQTTTQLETSWRVLDSGERYFTYQASRRGTEAQEFNALQTLRGTLFTVHQDYIEALRAQELLRVSDAQVARAKAILEQTEARIEAGDAPRKDRLQAQADFLNAQVQALQARNRSSTAEAFLKATIGLDRATPLPTLELAAVNEPAPPAQPLDQYVEEGLANRADLLARRRSIEATGYTLRRARREAGITFGLDASYDIQVTPDSFGSRFLTFNLSYPLFDGGQRREAAREVRYNQEAQEAELVQAEREVRAEIESAFAEYSQNRERLEAARSALAAAQENYNAAVESQRLGAADLIDVLTAQVSLVTAESNFIESSYDYTLSEVRLRVVSGQPIPGEQL